MPASARVPCGNGCDAGKVGFPSDDWNRAMTWRVQQILAGGIAGLILIARAQAAAWPDNAATRLEALALLQTLNADLLSNDSATLTLDRWCDAHKMATPAKIV